MDLNKEKYARLVKKTARPSPILRNCALAYLTGGIICVLGQGLYDLYAALTEYPPDDIYTLVTVTVIFLAALFTGLGWFDRLAKPAGAGTLVPVTGFANAVVSPAIDSGAEGLVLGVGAKIFTVAGPVILYGVLAGSLYGVILFLGGLL